MSNRVTSLITVLSVAGSACLLGSIVAREVGPAQIADALDHVAVLALWSAVLTIFVQRLAAQEISRSAAVPREWMPEVLDVYFSEDLVAEFTRSQHEILAECRRFRVQQGIETPFIRFRDDRLLASRSYWISVNGIRTFGATLGPSDDFPSKLLATLKSIWTRDADTIRFFAQLRAQTA